MGARLVHLSVSTSIMVTHKGRKGLAHDLKVWDHDHLSLWLGLVSKQHNMVATCGRIGPSAHGGQETKGCVLKTIQP